MEKIEFNEERARDLYQSGWSDAHIERELGLPPRTIGNWRKRNGLKSNYPPGWAALTPKERQEIIRRRQEEYRAEKDEKLRLQKELEERRLGECIKCRYRGTLDGYEICCDYCNITGHCRTAMPKRADGMCPAFEEGEPVQREVLYFEKPVKIIRKRSSRFNHEHMLEMYMEGKSDAEIAKASGCDKSTVYAWRHRNELPANEQERKSKYDEEKFRELWEQGLSDHKIARAMGCTESTVARWRHGEGLKSRAYDRKIDYGKVMKLYEEGLNDLQIAVALGCGETTIGRWRKDNNLPSQREIRWEEEGRKGFGK